MIFEMNWKIINTMKIIICWPISAAMRAYSPCHGQFGLTAAKAVVSWHLVKFRWPLPAPTAASTQIGRDRTPGGGRSDRGNHGRSKTMHVRASAKKKNVHKPKRGGILTLINPQGASRREKLMSWQVFFFFFSTSFSLPSFFVPFEVTPRLCQRTHRAEVELDYPPRPQAPQPIPTSSFAAALPPAVPPNAHKFSLKSSSAIFSIFLGSPVESPETTKAIQVVSFLFFFFVQWWNCLVGATSKQMIPAEEKYCDLRERNHVATLCLKALQSFLAPLPVAAVRVWAAQSQLILYRHLSNHSWQPWPLWSLLNKS